LNVADMNVLTFCLSGKCPKNLKNYCPHEGKKKANLNTAKSSQSTKNRFAVLPNIVGVSRP